VSDRDPKTVDAPQTITVTLLVGGSVPSNVDVYAAHGGTRDVLFTTNSQINGATTTQDGGQWLSLALDGAGSFVFPCRTGFTWRQPASMPLGMYTGAVIASGSNFAPDNKRIPVTMRLTDGPIAQGPAGRFRAWLAQGAHRRYRPPSR